MVVGVDGVAYCIVAGSNDVPGADNGSINELINYLGAGLGSCGGSRSGGSGGSRGGSSSGILSGGQAEQLHVSVGSRAVVAHVVYAAGGVILSVNGGGADGPIQIVAGSIVVPGIGGTSAGIQIAVAGAGVSHQVTAALITALDGVTAGGGSVEDPGAVIKIISVAGNTDNVAAVHGSGSGVAIVVGADAGVVVVGSGLVVVDSQICGAVYNEADEVLFTGGDGVGGYPLGSLGDGDVDGLRQNRLGLGGNGSGDRGGAGVDAGDGSGLTVGSGGNGGDVGVSRGPCNGVVVGVGGVSRDLNAIVLAHCHGGRGDGVAIVVGDVKADELNGLCIGEHCPIGSNGLSAVGIGGEGIGRAHDDGPCCAGAGGVSGIPVAVGALHGGDSLGNGSAVLHLSPEGGLILVIAGEGYGLRIAVNNSSACGKQSGTGGTLALFLHAFADSHPNEAVGKGAGSVVLDVTTVDTVEGPAVVSPTVGVVGGGQAGAAGQIQIRGIVGADAVTVGIVNDDALIGIVGGDGGTGGVGAGKGGQRAARSGCQRSSLGLVLIGEAGIGAVIGADEKYVCAGGAVGALGSLSPDLSGLGNSLHYLGGKAGDVRNVTYFVVITAAHAIRPEGEGVAIDIADGAFIDVGVDKSCLIDSHGSLGGGCARCEHLGLDLIEGSPDFLPMCFRLRTVDLIGGVFCHYGNGQNGNNHKSDKESSKDLLGLCHCVILLLRYKYERLFSHLSYFTSKNIYCPYQNSKKEYIIAVLLLFFILFHSFAKIHPAYLQSAYPAEILAMEWALSDMVRQMPNHCSSFTLNISVCFGRFICIR